MRIAYEGYVVAENITNEAGRAVLAELEKIAKAENINLIRQAVDDVPKARARLQGIVDKAVKATAAPTGPTSKRNKAPRSRAARAALKSGSHGKTGPASAGKTERASGKAGPARDRPSRAHAADGRRRLERPAQPASRQ